jgi:hypothetical protein
MSIHQFATVLFRVHGVVFCIWGIESTIRLWGLIPFYSADKMRELTWMWWLVFPAFELAIGIILFVSSRSLAKLVLPAFVWEWIEAGGVAGGWEKKRG